MQEELTIREKEILQLIVDEHSSAQMAAQLHLSIRTIETHRKHILQKTGSTTLFAIIKFAIRAGMMHGYNFTPIPTKN